MEDIVVGGGIAGLSAAIELARAGREVRVLERASSLGGRARTEARGGFRLNQGPRALYNEGPLAAMLAELDLELPGGPPGPDARVLLEDGQLARLPQSPAGLLSASWMSVRQRASFALALASMSRLRAHPGSAADALARFADPTVRALLSQLVRISTYCGDLEVVPARLAFTQVRRALSGVRYLDGGWSALVAALEERARDLGVRFERARVARVAPGRVDDRAAGAVIVALGRAAAEAVLPDEARLPSARPGIQVSCLDLLLDEDPGGPDFVTRLDEPVYLSVHSRVAALAPAGGALAHVMSYVPCARVELESLADSALPGWRSRVTHARFLPRTPVSHRAPALDDESGPWRALPGVHLAGEWLPAPVMLADAAAWTGRAAARDIVASESGRSAA